MFEISDTLPVIRSLIRVISDTKLLHLLSKVNENVHTYQLNGDELNAKNNFSNF